MSNDEGEALMLPQIFNRFMRVIDKNMCLGLSWSDLNWYYAPPKSEVLPS